MDRIMPKEIADRYLGFPPPSHPRYQPPTWLYVMDSLGVKKIGIAQNVEWRLKAIRCGNPHSVFVEGKFEVCRQFALQIEAAIHSHFADRRLSGEWFRDVSLDEIKAVLKTVRNRANTAMRRYDLDGHFNPNHRCSAYAAQRLAKKLAA